MKDSSIHLFNVLPTLLAWKAFKELTVASNE